MAKIEPLDDESPLGFVERVDTLKVSEEAITTILKEHFGFEDDGEIKELKLQSKPFWDRFYRGYVEGIFRRGGARYSAVKFIEKKNAHAEKRRKLSDVEIDEIVDSFGAWAR